MKNIRIKKLLIVKSIVILLGMAMLFSCKNDITAVSALAAGDSIPDLKAKNFEACYEAWQKGVHAVIPVEWLPNLKAL